MKPIEKINPKKNICTIQYLKQCRTMCILFYSLHRLVAVAWTKQAFTDPLLAFKSMYIINIIHEIRSDKFQRVYLLLHPDLSAKRYAIEYHMKMSSMLISKAKQHLLSICKLAYKFTWIFAHMDRWMDKRMNGRWT